MSELRFFAISSEAFSILEATYADTLLGSRYAFPVVVRPPEGPHVVRFVVLALWYPLPVGWWQGRPSHPVA